ncbi:hypothetical protein BpHYR1_007564 [Brachionus plicatilis]|uniref:Uncharacterized protein n=1 Tax=Brachionus plicatilis TaxID=10195 RepID=A0A3M7TC21_BRAPC|nr:hypothetical protein BpHYR1_007564 [Brachionus plicatilis]
MKVLSIKINKNKSILDEHFCEELKRLINKNSISIRNIFSSSIEKVGRHFHDNQQLIKNNIKLADEIKQNGINSVEANEDEYFILMVQTPIDHDELKAIQLKVVDGFGSCVEVNLVNECSTELSNEQTEINRSPWEDLTQMGAESCDLSPLNRSFIQAEEESGILRPERGVSNCLRCWYTNATSLNQDKLDELRVMCADAAPDIIFISELGTTMGRSFILRDMNVSGEIDEMEMVEGSVSTAKLREH